MLKMPKKAYFIRFQRCKKDSNLERHTSESKAQWSKSTDNHYDFEPWALSMLPINLPIWYHCCDHLIILRHAFSLLLLQIQRRPVLNDINYLIKALFSGKVGSCFRISNSVQR